MAQKPPCVIDNGTGYTKMGNLIVNLYLVFDFLVIFFFV